MSPAGTGLVLFTGGEGRRLGGPKHDRPHPAGGTWGGALLQAFRAARPEGPVQLVGAPLPDHPDRAALSDPREGPGVALAHWARSEPQGAVRWLLLACDQIRWTPAGLSSWLARAEAADPEGSAWVMAEVDGHRQYFGSLLGASLLPAVAAFQGRSLAALADTLPCRRLSDAAPHWQDVDVSTDLP